MDNEPEYLTYHERRQRVLAQVLFIILGGVAFLFVLLWLLGVNP